MKITSFSTKPIINNENKTKQSNPIQFAKKNNYSNMDLPRISAKLALVSFCGNIKRADRLNKSDYLISSYISEIGKARYLHGDRAVIDLSMGNPDLTPPEKAKQALKDKVGDLWSHRYNNPKGEGAFMYTAADWMKKRFGVDVKPKEEIMVTSGSSDAIDHIFTAYANHGDSILVPNPGYSLYDDLITRHDLNKKYYNLFPDNGYKPDFSKIPKDAKIMILNYPHNPTGSFADKEVFEEAVKFAKENDILLIHDMDNSEVTHTGKKPVGILEVDGAKEVAFQVHTMSKAQSMPGLRIAFAVSDKENINNLLQAKYLSGGSVYTPVQAAAIEALKDEEGYIDKINDIYRKRKNLTVDRLSKLGCDIKPSDGTYYLWAKIPEGFTSDEFYKYVLHKSQVALTPGTVFGNNGEGYVRIVMSADEKKLNEAFDSIEKNGIRFDVPKSELPQEIQDEIKQMADGTYSIVPKEDRDFAAYAEHIKAKNTTLKERFEDKDPKFEMFLPRPDLKLPWNVLKEGQSVYLQNIQEGKPDFGELVDITPFSDAKVYENLSSEMKSTWLKDEYKDKNILPVYRNQIFYDDANYFVLKADDKIQAIANIEIQKDGNLWVRGLNTAPWNQGDDSKFRGCGKSLMARMVSFCLETGNDSLFLATDKPENIKFYKGLGMSEVGKKDYNGEINTVLKFDKKAMELFLSKFQVNLSF